MFGHGKFGAYHDSIGFVAFVAELIEKLPDGHGKLIDQFRRALLSIPFKNLSAHAITDACALLVPENFRGLLS